MLLGIDCSTSVTGLAVVDNAGTLIAYEAVDTRNPNKYKNNFEKAEQVGKRISELVSQYNIKEIFIEAALMSFSAGKSSAMTISSLLKYNGMISMYIYTNIHKIPNYIESRSARSKCGIKIPRGEKAKKVVMKYLLDTEPSFRVEYTPKGNIAPKFFDMADAIIIARAGLCLIKS